MDASTPSGYAGGMDLRWEPLAVAILTALLGSTVIGPSAYAMETADSQALIDRDGNGRLVVNSAGGNWTWQACRGVSKECDPFGHGREIETGGAPPGTVFRGRNPTARVVSPEWRGQLRSLEAPSVTGTIRANEFVSPQPGLWAGGWQREFSELQLSACATPTGDGCVALTSLHFIRPCSPSAAFALSEAFIGKYLRVAERRIGGGPPLGLAYAVSSPAGDEVWGGSRTVAASVVGQIGPALGLFPGECGPLVKGSATISGDGVALVRCPAGCRASLTVSVLGRSRSVERTIGGDGILLVRPPAEMKLSPEQLRSLGAGKGRYSVKILGTTVASRTISIQPLARNPRSDQESQAFRTKFDSR